MTYKITYSKAFKKHYKKLPDVEKKQTKKKLEFFVENPTHPSLRTKKIKGGLWLMGIFCKYGYKNYLVL